jgi:shikimate dehydrogenase
LGINKGEISEKMKYFGLIGYPLGHSFSKKYFTEKFEKLGISDTHQYDLYEMQNLDFLQRFINDKDDLVGLNVTIPHKLNVMPLLSEIDPAAEKIGAVNVIKVLPDKSLKGYNSDYYGFKKSLSEFLGTTNNIKALVLGNGGAAKAILVALSDLSVPYTIVSRQSTDKAIDYAAASLLLEEYQLVINCSPIGTYPNVDAAPDLDYSKISKNHFFFDLVYNPEETQFMKLAKEKGAKTINGYDMLVYQAEKSWEIWNQE